MGISAIVFGLILCFFGAKLLIGIFVFVATIGILVVTNVYTYNLVIPYDASVPIIGVVVASISFVSILLSKFILDFTKKWAIVLVSAWLGIVFVLTVL